FVALINIASDSAANSDIIIAKSDDITVSGFEWGISFNSRLNFAYNDGAVRGFFVDTTPIPLNIWTQVVGQWNQATGNVTYFINGVQKTTDAATTGTILYNGDSLLLGNQVQNKMLDGLVDYVFLYNRALQPQEIAQLYHDPYAMFRAQNIFEYLGNPIGGTFGFADGEFFHVGTTAIYADGEFFWYVESVGGTEYAVSASVTSNFDATTSNNVDFPVTASAATEFDEATSNSLDIPVSASVTSDFDATVSNNIDAPVLATV
ncbi:unnamed protein product, partial [marine sediment metagenome]